ncbi:MAG: vitamin K epoxide reductase family protein [Nitrospirota bacterium]|nr:vitamin K epoxide reductase family protein [Nitrospirota bacterium]
MLQRLWLMTVGLAILFMALLWGEHFYRQVVSPSFDLCAIATGWACQDALQHPRSKLALLPVPIWAIAAYALALRLGPSSWGRRLFRYMAILFIALFLAASGVFLYFMAMDLANLCILCLGAHACHMVLAALLILGYRLNITSSPGVSVPPVSAYLIAPLLILLTGYGLTLWAGQQENRRALTHYLMKDDLLPGVLRWEFDRYYPEKPVHRIAGSKDARSQLTIVGSLACSHCRDAVRAVMVLPDQLKKEVAIFFIPYAFEGDCGSPSKESGKNRRRAPELCLMAEHTLQAQESGGFWDWFQEVDGAPGLIIRRFRKEARNRKEWSRELAAQIAAARDLSVTSLPLLLWNGQKLPAIVNTIALPDLLPYLLKQQDKPGGTPQDESCDTC